MESKSRQEKSKKLRRLWKAHLDKWEESGLSQSEYCRRHDLSRHRFSYWKARIRPQNLPVELAQVPSGALNVGPSVLKLNLPQGVQVEIPDNFSQETLERVLVTLRGV